MRIHRRFRELPGEARGTSVAIGNFDGLHLGHQAVLAAAAEAARRLGTRLGVVTFEPHPREVLNPAAAPSRLTPLHQKLRLLRDYGVEECFLLPFGPRLMRLSPEGFVGEVLVDAIGIGAIAAGEAFRFGHKRAGNLGLLAAIGAEAGFEVLPVGAVLLEGELCSSTRIRQHLAEGDVAAADRLLGRAYAVEGIVRPGDRRGKALGFPTANVHATDRRTMLPAQGIYAVRAGLRERDGGKRDGMVWHDAVASLGTNPTFGGTELRLEVHLLDGEHALYGRRLGVAFIERLRGEERYTSIEELTAQITKDCDAARRIHAAARAQGEGRRPWTGP